MTRTATAAVAALAATLALATPASASLLPTGPVPGGGAFVIQSCGESGSTQGWTSTNNAPTRVETFTDCPPSQGRMPEFPNDRVYTGIHAGGKRGRDSVTLDDAQAGDQAELTFTAAAGTQITRVRMWRSAGKVDDNDWLAYTKAGTTLIDGCEYAPPGFQCLAGSPGAWAPNGQNDMDPGYTSFYDSALPANLPNLAASTFTVGILCRFQGNSICANDYLYSSASAEVYSVFFTLSDASAPSLGSIGGGFAGTETITTRPTFTIGGSDNSGIRAARLYVDGTFVDEQQPSCSYDRPRPCSDLAVSGGLGFDPATVTDGNHQLQLAVVDAAGNETRSTPMTRTIDGTPPALPELTQTQPQINQSTITWTPAAAGAVATTGSEWRLCRYEGQECGAWTQVNAPAGSIEQPVYAPRLSVEVRNIDALGRTGPAASLALPWTYQPSAPPTTATTTGTSITPTTPTTTTPVPLARTTTRLTLAQPTVSSTRAVTLQGGVSVKTAKLVVTLGRKGHRAILRKTRATRGTFRLRIKNVPRGRWNLTVRYAGSRTTKPATAKRTVTVR